MLALASVQGLDETEATKKVRSTASFNILSSFLEMLSDALSFIDRDTKEIASFQSFLFPFPLHHSMHSLLLLAQVLSACCLLSYRIDVGFNHF